MSAEDQEDSSQISADQLKAMTADEIVQAQDGGRLNTLLGRPGSGGDFHG
jgi:hypothetical protein